MARRQWLHRNADIGTIEALDELDDDGSETPGAGGFLVPTWARYITRIGASGAMDGAAIGSGIMLGRLRGALANGDSELAFVIAGGGGQVATGTQNAMPPYLSPPLAVPVEPGARMKCYGEVFGDAENDSEIQIAVQFSDTPEPNGCKWARSYSADVDTVDSSTSLTGDFGSDTEPPTQVPKGAVELKWVSVVGAGAFDQAADGTYAAKVVVQAGPVLDQQDIPAGAGGSIAGQAGSDEGWMLVGATNVPVGAACVALVDLAGKVRGEQMGDDAGSGQVAATLWFA